MPQEPCWQSRLPGVFQPLNMRLGFLQFLLEARLFFGKVNHASKRKINFHRTNTRAADPGFVGQRIGTMLSSDSSSQPTPQCTLDCSFNKSSFAPAAIVAAIRLLGATFLSARRLRMARTIPCTSSKSAIFDASQPSHPVLRATWPRSRPRANQKQA